MTSKLTHFSSVTSSHTSSWMTSSSYELEILFCKNIKFIFKKVAPLCRTGLGWMCKLKSSLPHIWNCLLIHTYWTSSFLKNLCLAGDSEVLKKMFITVGVDISDQHGLSSEHHTYWGRFENKQFLYHVNCPQLYLI